MKLTKWIFFCFLLVFSFSVRAYNFAFYPYGINGDQDPEFSLFISDEFNDCPIRESSKQTGGILKCFNSTLPTHGFINITIFSSQTAESFLRTMEQQYTNSEKFKNGYIATHDRFDLFGVKGFRSEVHTTFDNREITLLLTSFTFKEKSFFLNIGALKDEFELKRNIYAQIPMSLRVLKGNESNVSSTKSNNKIENYKLQCKDIGYKPGTEKFGNCVLELNK